MALLQVFDPPMCCSTGVCGPNVDVAISRFAADLEWLKSQGVKVRRYNLAQEPRVFVDHELVSSALAKSGEKCLPIILLDGELIAEGAYPSREELAVLAGCQLAAAAAEETLKVVPCCTSAAGVSSRKCC
jgi:hypothetical protein